MDKNTLSNYGWIVICTLVLAVMLALATPFGEFIAGAFKATYAGFGNVTDNALAVIGIGNSGNGGSGEQGGETPDEPQENPNAIPSGYVYTIAATGEQLVGDGMSVEWPEETGAGDTIEGFNYKYTYTTFGNAGWSVALTDKTQTSYAPILDSIDIKLTTGLFSGCTNLTTAPAIPSRMTNINGAFNGCTSLTGVIEINSEPTSYTSCFGGVDFKAQNITLAGACSDALLDEIGATGINYCANCNGACKELNLNAIPVGGTYTMADGAVLVGDGSTVEWPAEVSDGDAYVYGNYEYRYNMYFYTDAWDVDTAQDGWGVRCINNVANPGAILETVNNKPITSLSYTFYECDNLEIAPALPETAIDMVSAFEGCTSLKSASKIPTAMTNMGTAFMNCTSLVNGPDLSGCTQITNMYATFQNCKSLTGTLTIDANLRSSGMYRFCFAGVDFAAQGLTLTGSSTTLAQLGATGSNYQG